MDVGIHQSVSPSVSELPFEYVERKGLGHPDSICDAIMESAAMALRRAYLSRYGRVLHHNLDKALLVAGQSVPKLGGGRIVSPIKIIAGDRASNEIDGQVIPVDEVVEASVRSWIKANLRFLDPDEHVVFRSEIKPGSAELTGIFDRTELVANDTSAAVGYAPLSETERIVLATEQYINSQDFKRNFPVAGEDVKVMAVRRGNKLSITAAIAFVDRFVPNVSSYFQQKAAIREALLRFVPELASQIQEFDLDVNMLDDPSLGETGMYLTVTGTSAEAGDGGEVGRGNSVNGLISLNRPTSNEAAAGKNSVCHVGNIYSHLSHKIANLIVTSVEPVDEAYVWLCSQIGQPIDKPWSACVQVSLAPSCRLEDVRESIDGIVQQSLESLKCGRGER